MSVVRCTGGRVRFEMWPIKALAILLLQADLCRSINYCCPGNTELEEGKAKCFNGSKLRLDCPNGMWKLDPKLSPDTDNFTLVEEEMAIVGNLRRVEENRFCVSTVNDSPVALVCFDPEATDWRAIGSGTLCILSAIFLYATLFVYAVLPELRDPQGRILMCAMSPLLGAYLMLAVVQLNPGLVEEAKTLCTCLAFVLYYCFMAAFFWFNLVAFDVWRSVWFTRTAFTVAAWFRIFSFIGWCVPGVFLATAIIGHLGIGNTLDTGFGVYSCWFAGPHETWVYLWGPVSCLMTLSVLYFSLTCYELWHRYRNFNGANLRVLRFKCLLYLKLVFVMGITWIFEVISFATGDDWTHYWIVTDILNALQGIVIFVLLIATRKRVRKLLARKRPLGISFPKSWAAGEDEECEVVVLSEEEVELSQTG